MSLLLVVVCWDGICAFCSFRVGASGLVCVLDRRCLIVGSWIWAFVAVVSGGVLVWWFSVGFAVRVIAAVVRVCGECVVGGIWCSLFVGFAFVW